MINWMYYPQYTAVDDKSDKIVQVFKDIADEIDSEVFTYPSNEVLFKLQTGLEYLGFDVEKGKKNSEKIHVPVLFGKNGEPQLAFDADAYDKDCRYVIEVEAGRAVVNYQFLKDFFEACTMVGVEYLCIAVRNVYKNRNDFEKVCSFFDAMYVSNRIQIPLKGLLIIGY